MQQPQMATKPTAAGTPAAPSVQPAQAMTVAQAARRLGIGRTMLYELMQRGKLPYHQVGRRRLLDPADVERFWEACRVDATTPGVLCRLANPRATIVSVPE
jgi:excisionase family DNA binding protein